MGSAIGIVGEVKSLATHRKRKKRTSLLQKEMASATLRIVSSEANLRTAALRTRRHMHMRSLKET